MSTNFSKDFFIGNRQRLRQLADDTLIVLPANGLLQRNADSAYKFRQDASFWYLTGLDEPDIVLVIDGSREYLIVPERDAVRQAFDGEIDGHLMTEISGISEILPAKEGWQELNARLKQEKMVAGITPPPAYIERHGLYANPARQALVGKLRAANKKLLVRDLRDHLAMLRAVKQAPELQALQAAIDITAEAIQDTWQPGRLAAYDFEYQIEADILRHFKTRGSSGHAFEPIIVTGKRACVLHNLSMDGPVNPHELLLYDIGAEVENYAADISRTVAVGRPSQRQQDIHAAVCDVQDFALAALKPGVMLKDYEQAVEAYMGKKLRQLKLINSNTSQDIRALYPHAASHFLGLDVHDSGLYDEPLAAGMVLTCEPGIYVAAEGIGVRIEDDVLITENGNQVLSHGLPRALTPA